jgi:hypothetical protein
MNSVLGQLGDQLSVFLHGPLQRSAELVARRFALDVFVDGLVDHVAHGAVFSEGHRSQPSGILISRHQKRLWMSRSIRSLPCQAESAERANERSQEASMEGKEPKFDGERLRAVRKERGLSAHDVERTACSPGEPSDGEAHLAAGGREAAHRGSGHVGAYCPRAGGG